MPRGIVLHDVPLIADDKVAQVEGLLRDEIDVEFVAVVSPGTELEMALLHVEGEVLGVEGAGGAEDSLRHPECLPFVVHYNQGVSLLSETIVGTARNDHKVTVLVVGHTVLTACMCEHAIIYT